MYDDLVTVTTTAYHVYGLIGRELLQSTCLTLFWHLIILVLLSPYCPTQRYSPFSCLWNSKTLLYDYVLGYYWEFYLKNNWKRFSNSELIDRTYPPFLYVQRNLRPSVIAKFLQILYITCLTNILNLNFYLSLFLDKQL